jgi:hypothetical protein
MKLEKQKNITAITNIDYKSIIITNKKIVIYNDELFTLNIPSLYTIVYKNIIDIKTSYQQMNIGFITRKTMKGKV